MTSLVRPTWILLALLAAFATPATRSAAPETPTELEEVLVTGEQPGPGMWRVSRAGHELWLLGTLDLLPKKMSWRATDADACIATSQEVLAPPAIDLHVGFFKGLAAVPAAMHVRKNPGGATLAGILPADLYARWRSLSARYLGSESSVERLRPLFAARELYRRAIDRAGLTWDPVVWSHVKESARNHRVPVSPVSLGITVDDPKGTVRQLERMTRDADVACLARTVERLETDLDGMRQRANLWARGDVAGLARLTYPDDRAACIDAVASVPELRAQLVEARDRLADAWLAAAEYALERNRSTFAVLPIAELVGANGALERLRAAGFEVEEP